MTALEVPDIEDIFLIVRRLRTWYIRETLEENDVNTIFATSSNTAVRGQPIKSHRNVSTGEQKSAHSDHAHSQTLLNITT
jgi:hypothetical protein